MGKTVARMIQGIVVVELKGKIDAATAAENERMLFERSAGVSQLVLDLSAVSYLNGAGLRVLLGAGKRLQEVGGQLIFCAAPSYIRQVLDMAGLTLLYPIFDTRAEALALADATR
jgi:anti-anti-sigma factor